MNEDPVDWTVSIAFGVATVSCPISETQTRYLRYNDALSRFSSYLSGQEEIAIYRLKTDEDLVDVYFVDEDDSNRAYACCTNTSSGETSAFPGPELTACGLEKGGHPYYKITVDRANGITSSSPAAGARPKPRSSNWEPPPILSITSKTTVPVSVPTYGPNPARLSPPPAQSPDAPAIPAF